MMIITPLTQDAIPSVIELMGSGAPYITARTYSDYWLYARLFSTSCPIALVGEQVVGAVIAFRSQDEPGDHDVHGVSVITDFKGPGRSRAVYEYRLT